MNHLKTGLAAVLISAGALTLTACGSTAIPDTINVQNVENNVISVSSREQVKVEPDIAEIIYSVYSQASDAPTCQTQDNSDLDKVLTILKEQGVDTVFGFPGGAILNIYDALYQPLNLL